MADGIVDLVSSGNTLRTNGLRSLGQLFSSQAVLIGKLGGDASQLVSMMRAVVEARAHRYLMLNTPESRLDEVCAIIGSRSPSVLPLAEPGMVAVHALVPSAEVWRLLPELEAAGASSILVVPVERMSRDGRTVRHETAPPEGGGVSIVEEIKREGDAAVRRWAVELDGAEPARAVAEPELLPREALLDLADRVRRWHEAQRPADISLEVEPGVLLERRWVPLETVGIYVPRNLVSTLVMCAVPAQAAGVERIVVCTPPAGAGLVAAAAEVLGIDEVWALGGPQAIGWLAYVRKVDKIVGPGNAYVNEAKLEVQRDVAIDLPGGPSEVVVRRVGRRRPAASSSSSSPRRPSTARTRVCRVVETLEEAEAIAPEHLVLLGDAEALAGQVRNAGAVFVGAVLAGRGRRLRDRRQPRPADERLGALDRRARDRDVPQADDDPAAHGRGPRADPADGRGARRRRGHARARRGGAAMKELSRRVPRLHLGAAERRGRAARRDRPVAGRPLRPEHAAAAAALDAARHDRRRARLDQRLPAGRLPRAAARDRRLQRRRARRTSCSAPAPTT